MEKEMVLMSTERVGRSIQRIACEIAEHHSANKPIVLVGIEKRGLTLAQMLAKELEVIHENSVEAIQLLNNHSENTLEKGKANKNESPVIFVVDDVIFSGQTMFRALKRVVDDLQPTEIHTVVLIDRGHRKFPVKAEFCGMQLPTKLKEHVAVELRGDQINEVYLHTSCNE